ncbi:MAG: YncE family protein [Planctomycetes bacterium]|nr:YncE family protein [Planctomycetota bacterium]
MPMLPGFPFCCTTTLLLTILVPPQDPAPRPTTVDRLLVCNKAARSLSVFDPATRSEIANLPTGEGPHEVAVSPDGRTAVVTDYGARKPGTTLTLVDLVRCEVLRTVEPSRSETGADGATTTRVLPRPHGIAFVDATSVVFTSELSRRLALFDLRTDRVVRTWTTTQRTMHMVALSPDRRTAHATSIEEGSLATFAIAGDASDAAPSAATIVTTGAGAEGLAVNPRSGEVWVGNRAANSVTVVDPKSGKASEPVATAEFPFRVVFTPDGALALVSCAEGGDVQVFDAATKKLVRSISIAADGSELGAMPMGICTDPEGARAYVACGRGEFVAVLDVASGRIVDKLDARQGPDGIAFARVPVESTAPGTVTR